MSQRLNHRAINPRAFNAMGGVYKHIESIDARLRALIDLRVSQLNGCLYCVDRHTQEARATGEGQQRLDHLPVWRESALFEPAERAALAWAEALTQIGESHAPDALYENLKAYFSEAQIVDLSLIVAIMNAWNRLGVGFRMQPEVRS